MTERKRMTDEEFFASAWDLIIQQKAAQFREEHPHLTKEQAIARSYSQYPAAYEAALALQRAKRQQQDE